jgi:hypothetical protein
VAYDIKLRIWNNQPPRTHLCLKRTIAGKCADRADENHIGQRERAHGIKRICIIVARFAMDLVVSVLVRRNIIALLADTCASFRRTSDHNHNLSDHRKA